MKKMRIIILFAVLIIGGLTAALFLRQAEPPVNENYQFTLVTDQLTNPVYMTHAGDERLFVVEKAGRIQIVQDGNLLESPFLDITNKVGSSGSEQGLLSVAFAPDYAESGQFYVYYTNRAGDTTVERYQVSVSDANQADPATAELILSQYQPYENHNGGLLKFGPDGYLYIGLGDGGAGGDPQDYAQNNFEWLGSILRIDVSQTPYVIPADNPFAAHENWRPEIWAYGLRNPWRFSFDRETGDLYIADVGQGDWEEINFEPADSPGGLNYGWDYYEGTHPYEDASSADMNALTFPAAEYSHDEGCSVTGGYVYRGADLPDLQGQYFYGDWCSGKIWTLSHDDEDTWTSTEFMDTDLNLTSFGEDVQGELYLTSDDDKLWKLTERTE